MIVTFAEIGARCYDVCVIGSGPAGTSLALELAGSRPDWKILLLEFGADGRMADELDASIVVTNPVNHHAPNECTNKGFGGTSATWGGRCVSYDGIDFMDGRPVIEGGCTWNLQIFEDAKRFYERASRYMDCGSPRFSLHEVPAGYPGPIAEGFKEGGVTDSVVERWSLPTRFGQRYRRQVEESPAIDLVLGVRAEELLAEAGKVLGLRAVNRADGAGATVAAEHFVVAAGAQESTRLLLKSPSVFDALPAPPHALGRYYQGHVSGKIASVRFAGNPKLTDYGFAMDDGAYVRRRFQFTDDLLLKENLLNTSIFLDNPLYADPSHRNGTMSFIYLMMVAPVIGNRLAPPAIQESVTRGKAHRVGAHVLNVLRGLPMSLITPFLIFVKRYLPERKLPGVFLYSPRNEYALHFHAEQVPTTSNRMRMCEDGAKLVIDYAYTDADVSSVIRTHELLDQALRHSGSGQLVYWYPREELPGRIRAMSRDGIHQVGTTRMSLQPESGVVDPDMRVWGTVNLYICSSSVFPTSGQANPTYLLVAFAARLARHLAAV